MEFFSLYLISSYIIYSIEENYMIDFNLSEHILSSLNQKELDLLKFIYLNSSAIARQTIQQFSNSVHVSSSSILRFCKKIGFSGFSELKYNIHTKSTNSSSCREKATSLENITKNILTDIEGSLSFTTSDDIHSIISLLDSNRDLYLYYPSGITDTVLDYLERQLLLCGRHNVFQVHSPKTANHLFPIVKKDTIFIFISASGTSMKTAQLAKNASTHGLTCISISPFSQNDLSNSCQYNIRFFTSPKDNNGAEYTSRFVIFFVIDILLNLYREKLGRK